MEVYLLLSSQRGAERDAQSEMWYVLKEKIGLNSETIHCAIPGLSILRIKESDLIQEVMMKLRKVITEEPLIACLRITPLEYLIKTDPERIKKTCVQYTDQIKPEETWRMLVRTRHTKIRSQNLIEVIAANFKNGKVDLEKPQKILRIEILGAKTGISLHKPNDVIRIAKIDGFSSESMEEL